MVGGGDPLSFSVNTLAIAGTILVKSAVYRNHLTYLHTMSNFFRRPKDLPAQLVREILCLVKRQKHNSKV